MKCNCRLYDMIYKVKFIRTPFGALLITKQIISYFEGVFQLTMILIVILYLNQIIVLLQRHTCLIFSGENLNKHEIVSLSSQQYLSKCNL